MTLVSIEANEEAAPTRTFHQFSTRLNLFRKTLQDFLTHDYEPSEQDIFWLDYTELRYPLFEEFQTVLKRVPSGSVIRITLRAEPELNLATLKDRVTDVDLNTIRIQMEKSFVDEFQKVLPHPPGSAFATLKDFARMVQLMVRRAASTALDFPGSHRDFLVVQSARYKDQTQMLSVTGVICRRDNSDTVREKLKDVRLVDFDWRDPVEIDVPALTAKERLHLERHLPVAPGLNAGEELQALLDYRIDNSEKTSVRQLGQYADYHREYPQFVRVAN